jgi:chromosome segregation ATPase
MPKGIMSWFFVESGEEDNQGNSEKEKKIKEIETAPPSSETLAEDQTGEKGKVSRKFVDILFKALRKNDLEGFDYMEFKKSLQSLKKMDMPIETRIQSAFAMAETMGVNKQHLLKTAAHYIKVLQQEEQKFEQALEKQQSKQIESKKGQLDQLSQTIEKKLAQIKKLEAEVAQHKEQINTLQNEIKGAATSIASTKNDFIASYNSLVNQIKQDMKHINDYLK